MNGRERVLAALAGEPVDRTPTCTPTSVATVELMDLVDAPFPAANRDAEMMARLAATSYTELGLDTIMPVFSIIQDSSALGCEIQWEGKDNWPTAKMTRPAVKLKYLRSAQSATPKTTLRLAEPRTSSSSCGSLSTQARTSLYCAQLATVTRR